jgi:outer membrane protein assembly factor BamB
MTYFPTWNGLLVAANYRTCETKWTINVTEIIQSFAPITSDQLLASQAVSRTSPTFDSHGVLYFGTQIHALLIAVDRLTGKTLGISQINNHPMAIVTMSPTVANVTSHPNMGALQEALFIGAASGEEAAAETVPGYVCCSFVISSHLE